MLYTSYYEQVMDDVKDYIESNEINIEEVDFESLYDEMFIADGVTGDGSGSYFFNTYKAMECVTRNMNEVKEALEDLCYTHEQVGEMFLNNQWEAIDVITRCYYLHGALSNYYEEKGVDCY